MRALRVLHWIVIWQFVTRRFDALRVRPTVASLVPDIEQTLAECIAAQAASVGDNPLAVARRKVVALDDVHDDAHRLVYRLVEAIADHGDDNQRGPARTLLSTLWGETLRVVNLSFAAEVAEARAFAERLASDDAQRALPAIRGILPGIDALLQAPIDAARGLDEALQALDAAAEQEVWTLSRARAESRRLWGVFRTALLHATRGDTPEDLVLRDEVLSAFAQQVHAATPARRPASAEGDAMGGGGGRQPIQPLPFGAGPAPAAPAPAEAADAPLPDADRP